MPGRHYQRVGAQMLNDIEVRARHVAAHHSSAHCGLAIAIDAANPPEFCRVSPQQLQI